MEEWDGGESAILAAWIGWRLGELQGTLNTINGVTDIGIGTVNQGITIANPLGQLFGLNPQIPLWDWSRGLIIDEDPTLHEWSKWLGGNGLVILGSTFLGMINGKGGPGKIDDAAERLSSITKKLRRFETLSLKDQVKEYGNLIKTYRKHLEKYGQKAGQTTGETNRMERELDAMRKLLEGRGRVFGLTGDLLS